MGGASKLSETAQVLFPSPALNPRVHCFILTQVALLVNLLEDGDRDKLDQVVAILLALLRY